jgi:hypothetical protein
MRAVAPSWSRGKCPAPAMVHSSTSPSRGQLSKRWRVVSAASLLSMSMGSRGVIVVPQPLRAAKRPLVSCAPG